jgi:hypothetical protein
MQQCSQCNSPILENQRFCSKCGASQTPLPDQGVYCEACHRELPFPMPFCKWCGMAQHGYSFPTGAETSVLSRSEHPTELIGDSPNTEADLKIGLTTPITSSSKTTKQSPTSSQLNEYDEEETLIRPTSKAGSVTSVLTLPETIPTARRYKLTPFILLAIFAMLLGAGISYVVLSLLNSSRAKNTDNNNAMPVLVVSSPSPDLSPTPTASPTITPTSTPSMSPSPTATPTPTPTAETPQAPTPAPATTPDAAVSQPVAVLPEGAPRNGTAKWQGTVVESTEIVLTGRNQSVAGNAVPLKSSYYTIDYGLPFVPAVVTVRKLQGRGEVFVVQQPNSSNGYSAHIKIVNAPEAKTDDYVLSITWEVAR